MPITRRSALTLALAGTALPCSVLAQSQGEDTITRAIIELRDRLRTAIAKRDRAALETLYADRFQHLRDSGRIDLKGDRITLLLSGETTIESAREDELAIHVYGPEAVVATGVSPIPDPAAGRPARFRWFALYLRQGDNWRLALSQASRLPAKR